MIIAQFSDTHIALSDIEAGSGTVSSLVTAVESLNALDPKPDVILMSGDITESGHAAEYECFLRLTEPLNVPMFLVPGNHDKRAAMSAVFKGSRLWPKDLDESLSSRWNYAVDTFPVRLLALDTLVEGESYGELTDDCLAWLDAKLAAQPGKPTIIFMHHPPFRTGIPKMDEIALRDPDRLARILSRHSNVSKVVCGHVHRAIHSQIAGISASVCPSTWKAIKLSMHSDAGIELASEPPAIHLHLVTGREAVTHESFVRRVGSEAA